MQPKHGSRRERSAFLVSLVDGQLVALPRTGQQASLSCLQGMDQAFAALEKAVWGCPWELTDNFVSAMREGRGRLTLSGPGDPTGRGLGFSFWRDERKVLRVYHCTYLLLQAQMSAASSPDGCLLGMHAPFWPVVMQSMLEGLSSHKKDAGQITGTNSDLRKLSMKASQRILTDYGVTESEIKGVDSM